jgi:ribosomal protein S18 acetylase RimI-like enzyme
MTTEATRSFPDGVVLRWRGPLEDEEMVDRVSSFGGTAVPGWWDQIRSHSLGWVTARIGDGLVVGFVNVVSDGSDHAFLIDTKTRAEFQRRQVGKRVVEFAAQHARAAGCNWLHVDFDDHLAIFYFDACGFEPTNAGLINLRSLPD